MTHLQKIRELTKKIKEIELEISQEKAYLSCYISKESNCINNSFKVGDIVKLKQTFEHLHDIYDCLVDAKKLIVSRLSSIIATVCLNNEKGENLGCWNYDRFELVERPLKKATGSTIPQGFKKGDIIRLKEDYSGLDASNTETYKHGIEYTVACDEYQMKDVVKGNNNNYVIDLVQTSTSMIYSERFELVRRPFTPKFKKGMTVRWKNPKSSYMIYIVEEDSYYRNFDGIEIVVTNGGIFPVNNVEEVEIKIKES